MPNGSVYRFAKTFDSVCHSKLIAKLKMYGICGSLLQWKDSFLTGRCHCIKVGNSLCGTSRILSVVLCVLDPFCFCST